jgi:hypothetical protein
VLPEIATSETAMPRPRPARYSCSDVSGATGAHLDDMRADFGVAQDAIRPEIYILNRSPIAETRKNNVSGAGQLRETVRDLGAL